MKQYKVGIIGGTGMVGQRFITLMEHHPWFQLTAIAASSTQRRQSLTPRRWRAAGPWTLPMPEEAKNLVVLDAEPDAEKLAWHGGFLLLRRGHEERGDPGPGGEIREDWSAPSSPTTPPTAGPTTYPW